MSNPQRLSYMICFTLKNGSALARDRLVDACDIQLRRISGNGCFAVPGIADETNNSGVDRGFHVVHPLVSRSRAAYEANQAEDSRRRFIEASRENPEQVRIFDAWTN